MGHVRLLFFRKLMKGFQKSVQISFMKEVEKTQYKESKNKGLAYISKEEAS